MHLGDRSQRTGISFMSDLRARLANRVQLTTGDHAAYLAAADAVDFDADYATLIKIFGPGPACPGRYSPPKVIGTRTEPIKGFPDPAYIQHVVRRAPEPSDAHADAPVHAIEHAPALYFFSYNWTRQHKAHRLSPAMAAGLTDKLWSLTDLASIIDDAQPKPGKRGPYKKRAAVAA
jgi:hypothetical protein